MAADSKTASSGIDDRSHQELLLLYSTTITDLSYFKTQQWATSNYALLLMAAIVGIYQLLGKNMAALERDVLVATAAVACVASLIVLGKLQASIIVRQDRLAHLRVRFSQAFLEAWNAGQKRPEIVHSVWLLRAAVVLGAVAVAWLLKVH